MTVKVRKMNEVNYLNLIGSFTAEENLFIGSVELFDWPVEGMSVVVTDSKLIGIRSIVRSGVGPVTQTIYRYSDRDGYVPGCWTYSLEIDLIGLEIKSFDPMSLAQAWDQLHQDLVKLP